ncbi:MAG: TMEM165/GDT1 family protein [Cyanobacteria bacterium CAN_BIN43]|nr:TMEM165/GDT1 family protein [Cyanobacteria bacterium CAN_BIN43]
MPLSSTSPSAESLSQSVLNLDSNTPQPEKTPWREELGIFVSTFFTIFLAELGDKTQLTTLLLSAQSHAPWIVFAGAGSALVATSLIGVLLGRWLAQRVPPRTLEVAAGGLLLLLAILLIWDVVRG